MPKPTAAANAPALPEAPSRHLGQLEGPIQDLAYAAELVLEGLIEAKAGEEGFTIIPDAIHWGLMQVLDRAADLSTEFYEIMRSRRETSHA